MDRLIDKMSEIASKDVSRRGFLGKCGMFCVGAAALVSGGAAGLLNIDVAKADVPYCCPGNQCDFYYCPSWTFDFGVQSGCCPNPGTCYQHAVGCDECRYRSGGLLYCYYPVPTNSYCPC